MLHASLLATDTRRFAAILRTGLLRRGPDGSFDTLTEILRAQLGVAISVVSLVTRDEQVFSGRSGLNLCGTPRKLAFCDHTIRTAEPMIVENALRDERFCKNALVTGPPGIRSYLGVPIRGADDSMIGTVCAIDTKPRVFSDQEIALVKGMGRIAEETIRLHHSNLTDMLTGVINRRGMGAAAENLFDEHKRTGAVHGLILVDLDHFKQVNDTHGHDTGDVALSSVAGKLCEVVREDAIVGRIGGEEFAILLPDHDEAATARTAEMIATSLRQSDTRHIAAGLRLTASFGVAALDGRVTSCSDWLAAADSALYRAKDLGRDRVCLSDR